MSNPSPARRLRTKTSDLTDFFRGNSGQSTSQTRPNLKEPSSSSTNLEVPSGDEGMGKKITRIPLFGRSRKKSNQSAASSPFVSTASTRDSSSELRIRPTSTDRRPHTASEPPLPALPSKHHGSSLGSKLAARFHPSRKSALPPSTPNPVPTPVPPRELSALSPTPPSHRSASFESGSSSGSKTRSTTPRPGRPTITVSLSPDNLEQFKDLFTRPHSSKSSRGSSQITLAPTQRIPEDADVTPGSNTSGSPRTRSPEQLSYPRRGFTPASAIAAAHRQNSSIGGERPPSTSSKQSSSRKNSDSDKGHEGTSSPHLRDSDVRDSPRNTPTPPEKDKTPVTRRASVTAGTNQPSESVFPTSRSRMKPPPSSRSRPPSMPLPLLPLTNPPATPPPEPPIQPQSIDGERPTSPKTLIRPRAHTIGSISVSVPPSPLSQSTLPALPSPKSIPAAVNTFDIDTAPAHQLREALKMRNFQYDELASYVLKVTENHVAEVQALDKKIQALEREAARREKEIKGLTWLINNGESPQQPKAVPPGILNHSRLSPTLAPAESEQEGRRYPPGSYRRVYYQSDSGAESHAHSGAESVRASGASGSESVTSSLRHKKYRRPSTLGENMYNICRVGSSRRSSLVPGGDGGSETSHPPPGLKRASLGSAVPSPASSTSSLLPPSPSITMSSLSAIPEGPTSLTLARHDSSSEQQQQEERRALRASHRISTSSMASSSTAASSAYSGNIKRSRPPSIAQVLEKSPNMEDVLEKLRPFA